MDSSSPIPPCGCGSTWSPHVCGYVAPRMGTLTTPISLTIERQPNILPLVDPRGIQARFERFHRENPHVYDRLRDLVLADVRAGFSIPGIDYYVNVLRWKLRVETCGDTFRLNNNFRSRYARLLMQEPGLAGVFETRRLQSA